MSRHALAQVPLNRAIYENLIINTENKVRNYFVKKGYLDAEVNIVQQEDTTVNNNVIMVINVDIGKRIKIRDINFSGNTHIKSKKLKRVFKDTKESRPYNIFTTSKYIPNLFKKELPMIVDKYNSKGYRDFKILRWFIVNSIYHYY